MSKPETKHYDGSYCPSCLSEEVEIYSSDHDFGYLELRIKCLKCDCHYTSQIQVSSNKLVLNEVFIE